MTLTTKSIMSAMALTERLLKLAESADRATIKHIVGDLEVQLAKIKQERELLIRENQELKRKAAC
ncbi:MAG TPA: hypothetical protein PLN21_00675 [Gemmatales bacterium]|nr:hypothetical protein [Gemmatales bacterium]